MLSRAHAASKKPVFGTGNFRKPVVCEGLAVHPDQIPEAIAEANKRGVPAPYFDEHGRPTFNDSATYRRYAKAHGFRHRGYV